jgi:putative tryptophan/tyrosine transport system substrate-binding protein
MRAAPPLMLRRAVVGGLLAGLATPCVGWSQSPSGMPVIGVLSGRSATETTHLLAAYREGLGESGYVDGRNVVIEYRWAEGRFERLPELAADLVRRKVAVISTLGGSPPAVVAKKATSTIPIVFLTGGDLEKLGLVTSMRRPVGNVTGVHQFATLLTAKRLELLRDVRPGVSRVAALFNPQNPAHEFTLTEVQQAARTLGLKVDLVNASTVSEVDRAFETLAKARSDALLVNADAFLDGRREQIAALAARHAVPAIYPWRDYVAAGGLLSYGADIADTYRQAGVYVGRILKGARPADLPIVQPSKFQLVVNLTTAKVLGVTIPPSVLARASEVIQ